MGNSCTSSSHRKKNKFKNIPAAFTGPEDCIFVGMALTDHTSDGGDNQLTFTRGDIVYVIQEKEEDFYFAEKYSDHSRGLVAKGIVQRQNGAPECVVGWRDVKSWEAESLLMKIGIETGTYIIRPSKAANIYAISVRDFDESTNSYHVKNFKIKVLNINKSSYCVNEYNFPDILTLIDYYKKNHIGQTQLYLTNPLPENYKPPTKFKDIEVNRENVEYVEIIGRGAFGIVHKAKWGRKYTVAAKVLNEKTFNDPQSRQNFITEAKIMHNLRHAKIVELLGVCTEPENSPIVILLEYMAHGSLKEYLEKNGKNIGIETMTAFMKDIAEGMLYLESQKIVHRDLRADNVLVSKILTAKVADFGLTDTICEENRDGTGKKKKRFPVKWTAPEAKETNVFNSKSDVWSFGVVLYEIFTRGSEPYPNYKPKETIRAVKEGYRMPNPNTLDPSINCPEEIYKLMLLCWHQIPDNRPSFSNILDIIYTNSLIYNS